jgi:CarboxypepD_reg-like domain/TonB-dependent Receptor Plug Domain
MSKRQALLFIFCCLQILPLSAQMLKGKILDERQSPLVAASVYWAQSQELNTASDLEGQFELPLPKRLPDTLVVHYFSYVELRLPFSALPAGPLVLELKSQPLSLDEVLIRSAAPILSDFAAIQLEPLQIWRNPVAAGDPLRAVNALPSSTNTQENANPALRGSDPEATRTILNGVPIYQAVRNSQLNGLGNFSVFNTAMLKNLTIYPGNPPLNYGNSAAGVIELETFDTAAMTTLELGVSLANVGLLAKGKLGRRSHAAAYVNGQFSDAFIGLNRSSLPFLKGFGALDGGLQVYHSLGKNWSMKLFAYAIDEHFAVTANSFGYEGPSKGGRQRYFQVFNLQGTLGKGTLRFDHGSNFSRNQFQFGLIDVNGREPSQYNALSWRQYVGKKWTLQAGFTQEWRRYQSEGTVPEIFFALAPRFPSFNVDTLVDNHNLEGYLVWKGLIGKHLTIAGGLRKNVPISGQSEYLSSQLNLRYALPQGQSVLASLGRYHYYAPATYFQMDFPLRRADQFSLDYQMQREKLLLTAAAYWKQEQGSQNNNLFISSNQRRIWGAEASAEWTPDGRWYVNLANTFLRVKEADESGKTWLGDNSLNWFVKCALRYEHPKLASLALNWIGRPGERYTPLDGAVPIPGLEGVWKPVFYNDFNSAVYPAYHNVSLSLSRYTPFRGGSLVVFANVNNLFNFRNPQNWIFSPDYQQQAYQYFQLRTVYFGVQWQLRAAD